MDIIFVLAVAIFIEKSCSQILNPSPTCFKDGNKIELECVTDNFDQGINFVLNTVPQVGCSPNCAPNIVQSGTTITTYTLSFNSSTHSGNWTCSYGLIESPVVVIAENPCPNGGGSTGLPPWAIGVIVVAVLAVFSGLAVVVCCILNKRCKFGDACRDSTLSFTFPPEKVIPKSNIGKDKGTHNKDGKPNITPEYKSSVEDGKPIQEDKDKVIPKGNIGKDIGTHNKDCKENTTPKQKSDVEEGIHIQEGVLNNELKNGISSLTTSKPRTGANQLLKPVF